MPQSTAHPPAEAGPSLFPLPWGEGQLSVIIPTLNAADTLKGLVEQLKAAAIVKEIVIADGGSSDETAAIARKAGALVIAAPRGRGVQLAAGAEAAAGDWLLFLHADCRLEAEWEPAVRAFLSTTGAGSHAGYFDFRLGDPTPPARRVERIVDWRCRVLALPYGDQGLLVARHLYDVLGGFAPLPLMEDVDFVRRLGRRRLARIGCCCIASPRRYRREGYWLRPMRNLFCLSLYFAGMAPHRIARFYG
jgi:rSAM/selenodomain-associated transferase 2